MFVCGFSCGAGTICAAEWLGEEREERSLEAFRSCNLRAGVRKLRRMLNQKRQMSLRR